MNLFSPEKFAEGSLIGVDGNIFSVIGYFSRIARASKWTSQEINKVTMAVQKATSYDQALAIIQTHITSPSENRGVTFESTLSEEKISDLLDEAHNLAEEYESKSNTVDQDSDYKSKLMETLHGEMLSALSHLAYEFNNNGYFFYADNPNDVGSHAEFLLSIESNPISTLINQQAKSPNFSNENYSQFLGHLTNAILEHIKSNQDKPNPHPKHWHSFEGRWEFKLCDCCGAITEGWDACDCEDEEDDD